LRHDSPGPPVRVPARVGALTGDSMRGLSGYEIPQEQRAALMRINIWIVLIVLIALFAGTRLLRYQQDTQRICADDPSASVCAR